MVRVEPLTDAVIAESLHVGEYVPLPPDRLTVTGPQFDNVTVGGVATIAGVGHTPAASPVKFTVTGCRVCPSEIVRVAEDGGAAELGARLTVKVLPEWVNTIELLLVEPT